MSSIPAQRDEAAIAARGDGRATRSTIMAYPWLAIPPYGNDGREHGTQLYAEPSPHIHRNPGALTMSSPQRNDNTAAALIRAWKASSSIRAEFPDISSYAAFVEAVRRGAVRDPGGKHAALMPETIIAQHQKDEPKKVTRPTASATVVVPQASKPLAAVTPPAQGRPMTKLQAGYWLSERFAHHQSEARRRGLSLRDATAEARRLVDTERGQMKIVSGTGEAAH